MLKTPVSLDAKLGFLDGLRGNGANRSPFCGYPNAVNQKKSSDFSELFFRYIG